MKIVILNFCSLIIFFQRNPFEYLRSCIPLAFVHHRNVFRLLVVKVEVLLFSGEVWPFPNTTSAKQYRFQHFGTLVNHHWDWDTFSPHQHFYPRQVTHAGQHKKLRQSCCSAKMDSPNICAGTISAICLLFFTASRGLRVVLCSAPSVSQSRRKPLLGPSPG